MLDKIPHFGGGLRDTFRFALSRYHTHGLIFSAFIGFIFFGSAQNNRMRALLAILFAYTLEDTTTSDHP
jgi:hypothetical protein